MHLQSTTLTYITSSTQASDPTLCNHSTSSSTPSNNYRIVLMSLKICSLCCLHFMTPNKLKSNTGKRVKEYQLSLHHLLLFFSSIKHTRVLHLNVLLNSG